MKTCLYCIVYDDLFILYCIRRLAYNALYEVSFILHYIILYMKTCLYCVYCIVKEDLRILHCE